MSIQIRSWGAVFGAVLCVAASGCGPSNGSLQGGLDPKEERTQQVSSFTSVGGSVLTYFDLGNYLSNPTSAMWDSDVKGMIAWYHLDPPAVRAKLAAMRANGQRRVGFVLWFVAPEPGGSVIARAHYIIPQPNFTLQPQHRANLQALLRDVDAAGFDEVQLRFGQQGGAVPHCYKNPACYASSEPITNPFLDEAIAFNWAFMKDVVSAAESAGVGVHRLYDFCAEYPGIKYMATTPGWYQFTHDIWARYRAELHGQGIDGTMSFNHADFAGTEASFKLFDELGWPDRLSIDVYFGIYGSLGTFADALTRHGKSGRSVFIQETYRNDPFTANELVRASQDFNLDIPFVMQWPAPTGHPEIMVADLSPYSEYLDLAHRPMPAAQPNLGTITVDAPTCSIPVGASSCTAIVRWNTTGPSDVKVMIEGSTLGAGVSGSQTVPWIPATYVRFDLYGDGQYLGSTRVTGVPEGVLAAAPQGTLNAQPSQCTIPTGQSSCSVTVTWNTVNARAVELKVGGQTVATALQGSQAVSVPAGSTNVELFADGARLAGTAVTGIAASAGTGQGALSANPPRCTIPTGASHCASTLSWSTTGMSSVQVKIDGHLFASGPDGSQSAPWISETPATFELWGDGVLLRTVTVQGVKGSGAGFITASPASCRVTAAGVCSVHLSWNVPGASNVQVRIGGSTFATSGPTGEQTAPWISLTPAVFEVWADGAKVDSLIVQGVR